jgi:hypothetical protein
MDDANLTPEEQGMLRDLYAYAAGSLDVSHAQLRSQMYDLTPEGMERIGTVLRQRVRASQARQRRYERIIERLIDRPES